MPRMTRLQADWVLSAIEQYATLDPDQRARTDLLDWVALECSCTRSQAERKIEQARKLIPEAPAGLEAATEPLVESAAAGPTPTPWRTTAEPPSDYDPLPTHALRDPHGNVIAVMEDNLEGGEPTAAANAEFICRACNAHAALVEALRHTLDYIGHHDNEEELVGNHLRAEILSALAWAKGEPHAQ